jgi:hypothetical protein
MRRVVPLHSISATAAKNLHQETNCPPILFNCELHMYDP